MQGRDKKEAKRKVRGKRGTKFRSGGDGGSFAIGTRPRIADGRRRRRNHVAASRGASRAARRSKTCSANPRNPRRAFSETELNELADSIRERGIIQPIVVRPVRGEDDNFEIIAGERRWRAAQRAGLHEVPVAVVEATDAQALEFAIIENVQRADLNAIEEAAGYLALMEEFNHSQDEVAQIVGKSRPHVANTLRLLQAVRAGAGAGRLRPVVGRARAHAGRPAERAANSRTTSSSAA